jgi:hypothetical protein
MLQKTVSVRCSIKPGARSTCHPEERTRKCEVAELRVTTSSFSPISISKNRDGLTSLEETATVCGMFSAISIPIVSLSHLYGWISAPSRCWMIGRKGRRGSGRGRCEETREARLVPGRPRFPLLSSPREPPGSTGEGVLFRGRTGSAIRREGRK